MCSCHSILECCVTFSGVKLSIRSFVLLLLLLACSQIAHQLYFSLKSASGFQTYVFPFHVIFSVLPQAVH